MVRGVLVFFFFFIKISSASHFLPFASSFLSFSFPFFSLLPSLRAFLFYEIRTKHQRKGGGGKGEGG